MTQQGPDRTWTATVNIVILREIHDTYMICDDLHEITISMNLRCKALLSCAMQQEKPLARFCGAL